MLFTVKGDENNNTLFYHFICLAPWKVRRFPILMLGFPHHGCVVIRIYVAPTTSQTSRLHMINSSKHQVRKALTVFNTWYMYAAEYINTTRVFLGFGGTTRSPGGWLYWCSQPQLLPLPLSFLSFAPANTRSACCSSLLVLFLS